MKVLVACEFSGVVRDAFIAKGHNAWSCDLLPTERPGPHIQRDVLKILDEGWELMIAHPPCTYLSNAGARHLYEYGILNQERYEKGMLAQKFFMCLLQGPVALVCIENPVPSKIFQLPQYNQIIQPYYFGNMIQKRTCLWLRGLSNLTYPDPPQKPESTKVAGNWFNVGGKQRQKNRAVTFQGIADAMAEQWG